MARVLARTPVRVLIIHPRDPAAPTLGGIQTFLLDYIKYLPPEFEITFAGITADRKARPIGRKTSVRISGRDVTLMPLASRGGLPRDPLGLLGAVLAQARLRLLMVRGGRILQVHRPYKPFFLAGHRGPRVQFIHVDIRDWPGPSAWRHVRGVYREFASKALEGMTRVFVVNEPGVEIIRREYPRIADRVDFLPVWFDPATFFPASADGRARLRGELSAQLGVAESEDAPIILFAARLDPIKDPDLALDAFAAMVAQDRPSARLVIAGSGDLRSRIERRAAELGLSDRVHLLGDVGRWRLADL